MKPMDDFRQYYAEYLDGVYEYIDRVVINAYNPICQSGGGFRHWWRSRRGTDESLSNDALKTMAGDFARRVRGWAKQHDVPVVDARARESA